MSKNANTILDIARGWIGRKESNGTHKEIIDVYNNHKPLSRGYKVKYTDSWCATFVSACVIKANYTDIIPLECSCNQMIKRFQSMGRWTEDDGHVPHLGDVIFYDWQDNGAGDNRGSSDHVGIVEKVANGKITVIEGNKSDAVARRVLNVNGRYIRGFGCPAYDNSTHVTTPTVQSNTSNALGTYVVTASALKVREGAGTNYRRKGKNELTADARKHCNANGGLLQGTRVTVKEIKNGWARIPSGWVYMGHLRKA